jgi:predicted esterase
VGVLLAAVVGAIGAPQRAGAQDLASAVAAFWAAEPGADSADAVDSILALDPDIESLWPLVRSGAVYESDVPRGRQVFSRQNRDGVEFRYELFVPESYDETRRYPVHVYLHGGVARPHREEARFWRNTGRHVRDDAIVVFPEAWDTTMWWQASQVENLGGILTDLKRRYNVNENAVHLMGVSDGATGAFYHAFKAPTPWATFVSFNGHPLVLANPSTLADGQMYVTNLRNKPILAINGAKDRLYPVSSVVPFFQLFVDAGVYLQFTPKPEGEHNMDWWDEERPNVDAFVVAQNRRPLPDQLVWETESTDQFNRAHWVVITDLGRVAGETDFDDFNEIVTAAPSAPLGFNMVGELDSGAGVQLVDIVPESMAEAAGVQAGDVLVAMNGVSVGNVEELRTAAQTRQDDPGIPVTVMRDGERMSFRLMPIQTGEAPPPREAFPRPDASGRVQLARNDNDIGVLTRGVRRYTLLLSPEQFDFSRPVRVTTNGIESFEGMVEPDPEALLRWADVDRDRTMLFGAALDIKVDAP